MGFNSTIIAIKSRNKSKILKTLKLKSLPNKPEFPDCGDLTGGFTNNGWYIIFDKHWKLIENMELLKKLSEEYEIVYAEIGEGWLAASTGRLAKGKRTWLVSHDSNKGEDHLEVKGKPPKVFQTLRETLDSNTNSGADLFSLPTNLFSELVGYCYYLSTGVLEENTFEYLDFKSTFPSNLELPSEEEIKEGKLAIKKWKEASGEEKLRLTEEIVKSKVLAGKTKKQVIQLIGEPINWHPEYLESSIYNYPYDDKYEISVFFDKDGMYKTFLLSEIETAEQFMARHPNFPPPSQK